MEQDHYIHAFINGKKLELHKGGKYACLAWSPTDIYMPLWAYLRPYYSDFCISLWQILAIYGCQEDFTEVSVKTMQEFSGGRPSKRTILRCLKSLKEQGAIQVTKQYGKDGQQLANLYFLPDEDPFAGKKQKNDFSNIRQISA